jgi:hypothetical protein
MWEHILCKGFQDRAFIPPRRDIMESYPMTLAVIVIISYAYATITPQ